MGTVIVLGSLITDLVARAPRLPYAGEVLIGNEFGTFIGGKGLNAAIAAARWGAQVTLIGRVGQDAFGDAFFPVLAQEGISSDFVTRDPQMGTGVSSILIGEDSGQNVIVAMPQANFAMTAEEVQEAFQHVLAQDNMHNVQSRNVFLTQCETSTVSYTTGLRLAREAGMTTILNMAPIPREPLPDEVLSLVDMLIVNETEAEALSGMSIPSLLAAQQAAEKLQEYGEHSGRGIREAIITLGERGTFWRCHEAGHEPQNEWIQAFVVQPVDATAAGDAFCGTLAACLAENMDMPSSLRTANAAGAITVTRRGAVPSLPTAAEIAALLRR